MVKGSFYLYFYRTLVFERQANGCRGGEVVRALASCQYGPGSIPRLGIICGLSLLVFYRVFYSGYSGFPSPQKPKFDLICVNC